MRRRKFTHEKSKKFTQADLNTLSSSITHEMEEINLHKSDGTIIRFVSPNCDAIVLSSEPELSTDNSTTRNVLREASNKFPRPNQPNVIMYYTGHGDKSDNSWAFKEPTIHLDEVPGANYVLVVDDYHIGPQSNDSILKCNADTECQYLSILITALKDYHSFTDQYKYHHDDKIIPICEQLDTVSILDAFHHLLFNHDDQFELIHSTFLMQCYNGNICPVWKCSMFERNRIDRKKYEGKLHNDMILQQLLDRVHCYYFHTFDTGYRLTADEKQYILNNGSKNDGNNCDSNETIVILKKK
eukprot:402389_1